VRIAYLVYWNAFEFDGVTRKLVAQVSAWQALGHEVELFCVSPGGPGTPQVPGRVFGARNAFERLRATWAAGREIRRWGPDVLYLRLDLWAPSVWLLVRRLRTIVEVNGYDRVPTPWHRLPVRWLRLLNYEALLRAANGLVVVTPSLVPPFSRYRKPIEVVTNGVDVDAIEPAPPEGGPRPRLVFVGSGDQPWQGVDKLVRLGELLPEVDVDVVGVPDPDAATPPNVHLHGRLDRDAYAALIRSADVGVGPLALHRKQLDEAAALKVREYLAYGLPVVLAGEDGDFVGEEPWFLLRLPNTESNVEERSDAVRAFLQRVRGRRVARDEVRDRIDTRSKERRRVAFMARFAG
jgi:glycosyltransferase involved in cell wall biosynthesis